MMNSPGVLNKDPEVMRKIEAAKNAGKPIDGHYPLATGPKLKAYIESGISTDHETIYLEKGREKCELGMHVLIREGSAAKNFDALHPLLKEYPESCSVRMTHILRF
jgi:adenine deaminase